MAGYTRQSTFADGDTITAALFNNEYNQLLNAFSNTSGHKHDGTAAEGPVIGLIGDAGETSPNNKVLIDTTNNFIEFYVQVSSSSVQQLYIADGAIIPVTDSDIDLGTTSLRFKDTYTDTITTTGNVAVGGNLTVTGTTTFNGGTITMGDAATDNVVFGADVDSNIIPDDDDSYDLGSSSQEWRNLYIDGTANIDSLVADTADINGGTIDGAVIGGSSAAAITGTTITGTAITGTSFVIGSANISEAELEILDGATVTTAELNILDGVTSTAAELNILDGVTSTAAEINLLDGVTSTTAELNILDGVTASATDINLIDGITNGTVIASKAIITDANKDITGGRNITITGELDAATLDISGNADIDGTLETDALSINGTTVTSTAAELNILDGVTATAAEINALDGITSTVAELNILDGVTSTAAELNLLDGKAFLDEDDMSSNSATGIASQQSIKAYVDTQITAEDLDITTDSGTIAIDLDSETLTVSGGTGLDSSATGNAVTLAIDSTVATLTGSQTLTNKSLTAPTLTGTAVVASLDISGDIDVDGTTNLDVVDIDGAVDMASTLNVSGAITGTLATAAQPNITSVGTLTGLTTTGDINFGDNDKAVFGAGSDLQIYHDGSNSWIKDEGTGVLAITTNGNGIGFYDSAGAEPMLFATKDNSVDLYFNGSKKLATTSTGIDVTGTANANSVAITNDAANLSIQNAAADTGQKFRRNGNNDLIFERFASGSTSETMRLDASGNVLVGNTDSTPYDRTSGNAIALGDGLISSAQEGGNAAIFNRMTSDGSIVGFRKDGTSVGSIGSTSGVVSHIVLDPRSSLKGAGIVGGSIDANTGIINPVDKTGAIADGAINLGGSSSRWKDLHLSGTANLGGTSASQSLIQMLANSTNGANTIHFGDATSGSASYTGYINYAHDSNSLQFATNGGSERMRIDSSGNVGIAAVPSGEAAAAHVVRLGDQVCIAEYDDGSNPEQFNLFHNSDSAETYIETGTASVIQQRAGEIIFKNAASGSAGAAISFSERMRIDSSGNVGIGRTPISYANSQNTLVIEDSHSPAIAWSDTGQARDWFAVAQGSGLHFVYADDGGTGGAANVTTSLVLDNSGNVGIGTDSPTDYYSGGDNLVVNTGTGEGGITLASTGSNQWNYILFADGTSGDAAYRGQVAYNHAVDQLYLASSDFLTFATGSSRTEKMRIASTGEVLFDKTSTSVNVAGGYIDGGECIMTISNAGNTYLVRSTNTSSYTFYVSGAGQIHAVQTSISSISDERLKENIKDIDTGLSEVMALKPRKFDWKEGEGSNEKNVTGFVAQEVETVLPNLIGDFEHDDLDDAKSVKMGDMIPTLVKAIQEQQTQIDALQSEINLLKGE